MTGMPSPLHGPDDLSTFVPIVVVVRQYDLDMLTEWAATHELQAEIRWAISVLAVSNGFTEEMLKLGSLLAAAAESQATPNQRRKR